MKKLLALILALCMVLALCACGTAAPAQTTAPAAETAEATAETTAETAAGTTAETTAAASDIKIGLICVHDETIGYDQAHIDGFKTAIEACGLTDANYIIKTNIPEGPDCYDACIDLVEQGCTLIITDSFGHATYAQQAATECPDVQFISMTGNNALSSGLSNLHNMFPHTFESRFVSGVVAGMKLQELIDSGKVADSNYDDNGKIKIGYVGAFPYAEVISGFTAFYLGIKYIVGDVVDMYVTYTNSWADAAAEQEAGQSLIADGCIILSQHADSQGMPTTCQAELEKGTTVYAVGYNVDMLNVAPDAALTSAQNNWSAFYEYAINCMLNGETIPVDYSVGYEGDGVMISQLGASCAAGTQEKVDEVIAALKDGSLQIFDTANFTVDGEHPTSFLVDVTGDFVGDEGYEAIENGIFYESKIMSAPYFSYIIDGVYPMN